MDKIKKYFPEEFNLAHEEPDYSSPCSKDDGKHEKVRICYPSLYIGRGPDGLAAAAKKIMAAAEDTEGEFYILAKVKVTRATETTVIDKKSGDVEEDSGLDLEIQKICLPDMADEAFHDKDVMDEEEADEMREMAKIAKKIGIKDTGYEDIDEADEDETE